MELGSFSRLTDKYNFLRWSCRVGTEVRHLLHKIGTQVQILTQMLFEYRGPSVIPASDVETGDRHVSELKIRLRDSESMNKVEYQSRMVPDFNLGPLQVCTHTDTHTHAEKVNTHTPHTHTCTRQWINKTQGSNSGLWGCDVATFDSDVALSAS